MEAVDFAIGAQKSFLDHLFRVGLVADHAVGDQVDPSAMSFHQLAEIIPLFISCAGHQCSFRPLHVPLDG